MARMYSRARGKSKSKKPGIKKKKTWVRYTAKEVETLIIKLAKSGHTSSQIGLILRDSYGIPEVKEITKLRITQILQKNKLTTQIPEALTNLIKRQIALMKHLELNKQDKTAKRGLQLTESKIRRLIKYYKKSKVLPADWAYDRTKAKLLVG